VQLFGAREFRNEKQKLKANYYTKICRCMFTRVLASKKSEETMQPYLQILRVHCVSLSVADINVGG